MNRPNAVFQIPVERLIATSVPVAPIVTELMYEPAAASLIVAVIFMCSDEVTFLFVSLTDIEGLTDIDEVKISILE